MKSSKRKRVIFGIDEGLPARVAASILRNQDFDLLAVHLYCDLAKIGEDPMTYPTAMQASDLPRIEKFCESLGVPLKCIDVTDEVLAKVYTPFWIATLSGARSAGISNWGREVLFPRLEQIATARGGEAIATGHFAMRAPELYRYSDVAFDQSRTLARVERKLLDRLELPIGAVSVEMLMRLAREIGAAPKGEGPSSLENEIRGLTEARSKRGVWEWTDAQLADPRVQARAAGDFFKPGPLSGSGEIAVGEHRGIPFYQVGSRSPEYPGYFVQEIHPQSRTLIVAPEGGLAFDSLLAHDLVWSEPRAKIAHRQRRVFVEKEPANLRVPKLGPEQVPGNLLEYPGQIAEIRLEQPLFGVAPGEVLIFFEESRVLGSAIVADRERMKSREKAIEKPASPA